MKSQVVGLRVASAVFGVATLGQLARLAVRPEVMIERHVLPLWPSGVAVVILGGLCLWLWKLSMPPAGEKDQRRDS